MARYKKIISVQLIIAIIFSMLTLSGGFSTVSAATKGKINKTKIVLTLGETTQLKVNNVKGKIKWSSNKKSVATVSKKGKVKSQKLGKATITAKVGKKKFRCKVTVYAKGEINNTNITLSVGKTFQLSVSKVKQKIKWSSSNVTVATVTQKGLVTAVKSGIATITAKVNKQTFTCMITIPTVITLPTTTPPPTTPSPTTPPTTPVIDVPKFLGYKVESVYKSNKNKASSIKSNSFKINLDESVEDPEDEPEENLEEPREVELSDSMLANRNIAVSTTLVLKNEKRDSIIEIILDDSDYGINQVYTSSASINKIESVDTVYNESEGIYYTYVVLMMPKSKATTTRTINMKEITYLRNVSEEGKCFMGDAISRKLNIEIFKTPLPSYPKYFNFVKNETGYTLASLNFNYEIPEILYIPSEYNGLPVNKTTYQALNNAVTVIHLVIPESITYIDANLCISCPSMKSITMLSQTPPTLVTFALDDNQLNGALAIFVPKESYNLYANDKNELYGIWTSAYKDLIESYEDITEIDYYS